MSTFPTELRSRLATAIRTAAESTGAPADAEALTAVIEPARQFAHESGMLPEAMVIALRHA